MLDPAQYPRNYTPRRSNARADGPGSAILPAILVGGRFEWILESRIDIAEMICTCVFSDQWCRRRDSNSRPRDYETLALPLSYTGENEQPMLRRRSNYCQASKDCARKKRSDKINMLFNEVRISPGQNTGFTVFRKNANVGHPTNSL